MRTAHFLGCLVLFSGVLLQPAVSPGSPPVGAEASQLPMAGQPPASQLTVSDLIDSLGSPDYDERRRATEGLKSKDKSFTVELKRIYRSEHDHEIRLRLLEIAEHLFMRTAQEQMGGFLGISLRAVDDGDDPRLSEGQAAIRVEQVLPGTAADRAGLLVKDLIIAIEDEELEITKNDRSAFIALVGSKPPGTTMQLVILRDKDPFLATVVLGHKPVIGLRGMRLTLSPDQRAAYDDAHREFREWCADLDAAP